MAQNKKGKPSDGQRKKPRFPGQYKSTGNKQDGYKTMTIRCDEETIQLTKDLGKPLNLTSTDVVKLGIRLVQRHLDGLLENPNRLISELMTRFVPDLKKFDIILGRFSKGGRSELAAIWRDFEAVQRIENDDLREQALDTLAQKLKFIFTRAKLKEPRKAVSDEPMEVTGLELA
jgi:hypothetical protein